MDRIEFIVNHLHLLYHFPIYVFQDAKYIYSPGEDLSEPNPFTSDIRLFESLTKDKSLSPFIRIMEDTIFYGAVCNEMGDIWVIIGPIAISPISGNSLHQYKKVHNLMNYNHFKIMTGLKQGAAAALSLLNLELTGIMHNSRKILEPLEVSPEDSEISEKELFKYRFQNVLDNQDHLAFTVEQKMMASITNGDLEGLHRIMEHDYSDKVGIMANTHFKQIEYTLVTGMALFGRAAIKGGADPEEVFSISDIHKRKIAEASDENEMARIFESAQIAFVKSVIRAKSRKSGNIYIEQIKRYVAKNLHSPITLDAIANHIGINKFYLTHQFTLETGQTLKAYIHQERVTAAKNMLKFSDQTIASIGEYLCFNSQSHFTSVFKRITGTTPGAYRTSNKMPGF